jgi:hypothetical protein
METLTIVTVGKTDYTVEALDTPDTFVLTGPRGGQLIAVPYVDNSEVFHAFRARGTHADLMDPATGRPARFSREQLTGK